MLPAWGHWRMNAFNEFQQQSVRITFLDIHRRMVDMEASLAQSTIASPFNGLIGDLSPTERSVILDYFARLRSVMLAHLEQTGIPLDVRRTSLRWSLQCGLTGLAVAVAE
jgi:hypothetical protein